MEFTLTLNKILSLLVFLFLFLNVKIKVHYKYFELAIYIQTNGRIMRSEILMITIRKKERNKHSFGYTNKTQKKNKKKSNK